MQIQAECQASGINFPLDSNGGLLLLHQSMSPPPPGRTVQSTDVTRFGATPLYTVIG